MRRTSIAAVAVLLAVAGCSRGGGAAAPTPGPCASHRPPIGPGVTTSLQAGDSGTTLCIHKGEAFSVFLNTTLGQDKWARVDSSRESVLTRRPTNQVTLARGVTAAIFVGRKKGVTELSSVRPPCADPHNCDAAHAWTAVIVVE